MQALQRHFADYAAHPTTALNKATHSAGIPMIAGALLGVALQYLGHLAFEGRSPAFHRNAIHTLIGPLWMAASLFETLGLYRFDAAD